ncbi:MAG TPA: hypothetical protein VN821_06520 [Candidatus Udaeobacter sp.]|nr:hypothetical protein [Candidatus Udaeobacter sp.]
MGYCLLMRRRFSHDGRWLEVRAAQYSGSWHLGIFESSQPITRELASLSDRDVEFARKKQGVDLIQSAMVRVQHDVESGQVNLPPARSGSAGA